MTIKELETQVLALTPTEKAEAITILTQSLKNSGRPITKTPGVMGGDACIDNTRIPVWLLASYHNDGATDAFIGSTSYQLSKIAP